MKEHDVKYYEFVPGDTIEIAPGRTLKRIRAVAEIAARGVAAGQLGGYIEREKNLFGDAWVFEGAQVYASAAVLADRASREPSLQGDAQPTSATLRCRRCGDTAYVSFSYARAAHHKQGDE